MAHLRDTDLLLLMANQAEAPRKSEKKTQKPEESHG